VADIIQIRRDTAANWTSTDPTLALGEMGYETDTNKMKYGDGSTAWISLSYYGGTDANAIHDNIANEITAITENTSPTWDDEIVTEDSANSFNKKSVKFNNFILDGGTF